MQTDGGASYGKQAGEEVRPVSKLDPTKALKVSASPKPRSKGRVFGAIAQRGGVHRRDVATVFDVMNSLIKADLPGAVRITVRRTGPRTRRSVMSTSSNGEHHRVAAETVARTSGHRLPRFSRPGRRTG